jgi:hypothetical protein
MAVMSHSFPMVRAGGLFILIMGLGVVLGGVFSSQRRLLLALGGAAATLVMILTANTLTRPLGSPTLTQYWALAASILLEVVLIRFVVARYREGGERTFLLSILFVVGFHFLPMAIAFGPLCAILGAADLANAGTGLWVKRDVSLNSLWIVDGALKIVFGGLMYSMVSNSGVT